MKATGLVRMTVNKKSLTEVTSNIRMLFEKQGVTAQKKGLITVAEKIMERSKTEVPVDTGTLKSTAFIKQPENTLTGVKITMGYAGPNDKLNPTEVKTGIKGLTRKRMASEYALEVHENLINKHKGGTKAKFLEDPARQFQREMLRILEGELRLVFSPGIKLR